MSTFSRPSGHTTHITRREHDCPRRPIRHGDHLSELGVEVTATRLRTLGHPTRLRIIRALDGRTATVEQLARELRLDERAVRAHVRLLYRAGILARVDDAGPPAYTLADWPSMWLVDQLARRLRDRTTRVDAAVHAHHEGRRP
jgi:DNA-binding transcriptional ArsR family regulator